MVGSDQIDVLFNPTKMIGLLNYLFLVTCIGGSVLVVDYGMKHEEEIQDKREKEMEEGRKLFRKYLETRVFKDYCKYLDWKYTYNNGKDIIQNEIAVLSAIRGKGDYYEYL